MIRGNAVPLNPRPNGVDGYPTGERHFFGASGRPNNVGMGNHGAMMHDASHFVKCLMHHQHDYSCIMSDPASRLKQARINAGYSSAKVAAEAMGVSVPTYIQHENGTRGYPAERAQRYARFFRTKPEWLLYGKSTQERLTLATLGPQIPIQGVVAAGVFRERMEFPEDEWETFTGAAGIAAPINERFGLKVEGNSMDMVYPPGTILECVRFWGDHPIENGRKVIVQRTRCTDEVETTVKEYHRDADGIEWLVPRSTNPAFQSPFRCDQPEQGIVDVRIIAVVVASIRYE